MVLEGRGAFLSPSGAAASARAFSAVAGRVGTVQLPAFMRAGECPASLDDPPERKPSRMFSLIATKSQLFGSGAFSDVERASPSQAFSHLLTVTADLQ